MNSTTLTGIVATIPKVRIALDGSDFVRFGLLVDRSESGDQALVPVTAFGDLVRSAWDKKPGDVVLVSGRVGDVVPTKWDEPAEVSGYRIEIVAKEIHSIKNISDQVVLEEPRLGEDSLSAEEVYR